MRRLIEGICVAMALCSGVYGATVSIDPSATFVTAGSPVSLNVNMSGFSDLYAFQFDIGFNPSLLSASTVTEGSLFNNLGAFFSPGFTDNIGGSITFISDALSGPGPGLSADGALVKLTFQAVGAGATSIDLSNVVLLDSNLNDISASPESATVTITGTSAAPEPGAWAVLALLLPAMGIAAARKPRWAKIKR
jgi:hypothetical protein